MGIGEGIVLLVLVLYGALFFRRVLPKGQASEDHQSGQL